MRQRAPRRTFFITGTVCFTVLTLANLSYVSTPISALLKVIFPILLGLCFAFILNIPLCPLERLWIRIFGDGKRALRRGVCIVICLGAITGIIAAVAVCLLPQLMISVGDLIKNIPLYLSKLSSWWNSAATRLEALSVPLPTFDISSDDIMASLSAYVEEHRHIILGAAISTFSLIFDIALATVIAIYILASKERLARQANKLLVSVMSAERLKSLYSFLALTRGIFVKFLTGQLIEAVIIGVLCFIGMLIFGMPYSLLISVLVGLTALVPIFGAFIGTGIGAFLILMVDPLKALIFVAFIIVLQQLEGNLIYPRVVGRSVGLPGLWVIVAVTVGSSFGVVGMLLAVPIMSVIYCLAASLAERKNTTKNTDC